MKRSTQIIAGITCLALALPGQAVLAKNHSGSWSYSFGGKNKRGSGHDVTVERQLKPFSSIETNGSFDIHVVIGPEQKVTLTYDDNLIDNVIMEVHGDVLEITTEGSFSSHGNGEIEIVIPKLEQIESSGSGDIEVEKLEGHAFDFYLSGSGNFVAEGKVDELNIKLSGSGDVDTRYLKASDVSVGLSGSGMVKVYAMESFDGSVSGSGDIYYYGDPKTTNKSVSGSGEIRRR